MKTRFATKEFGIVSFDTAPETVLTPEHLTFSMPIEEFATDTALLKKLNLVSLYAESLERNISPSVWFWDRAERTTPEYCAQFMRSYLHGFNSALPPIEPGEILTVMITAPELRKEVLPIVRF